MVAFLREALRKKGCPEPTFACKPCPEHPMQAGKFDPHSGRIEICEEAIQSVSHVEDTLSHELIHAYDHCRIEWQEESTLTIIAAEYCRFATSGLL